MSKENIYQIVEKNYNITNEIRKIHDILTLENFFCYTRTNDNQHTAMITYRFFDFADKVLFEFIQEKGTCLSLAEFMARADAILEFGEQGNISEYRIANYLEIVENLLNIYFSHIKYFKKKRGFEIYSNAYDKVVFLMTVLENHLHLTKRVKKDKVILEKIEITKK